MKGVVRTSKMNKLDPRYVGPFKILDRIGIIAYRLALPLEMERIHSVFHVLQLKKYVPNASRDILSTPTTPRRHTLCGGTNSNNRLQGETVKEQRNLSGEIHMEKQKIEEATWE